MSLSPAGDGLPEVADPDGERLVVAETFINAVAWGEHTKVWDLLAREGRSTVLKVAVTRGMDEALAARLRDGTAVKSERDDFLTDLVNGLRADLAGSDLDSLVYEVQPGSDAGQAHVLARSPLPFGLGLAGLPVAMVELVRERGAWKVQRMAPQAKK